MKDDGRIERLISLAERIITALEGDIAALKEGRTGALSTNDPEILDEVYRLLNELKEAWEAIGADGAKQAAAQVPPALNIDPLAPRISRLVKA